MADYKLGDNVVFKLPSSKTFNGVITYISIQGKTLVIKCSGGSFRAFKNEIIGYSSELSKILYD